MARKKRLFFRDTPQHVVIKGINDKVIFLEDEDYIAFLDILKVLVANIEIEIHSYVLMPTYFQFLATPLHENALSKFMQSLGRRYVGYFNKKYERKGTLWEGRYKSSLVQSDKYLYDVMKFIECQPPKCKEYTYSSIQKNCFSKDDVIITLHKIYQQFKYIDILNDSSDNNVNAFIASSLEKQTVTGTNIFCKELEQKLGKVLVSSKKRGRPKKENIDKRKKMYDNLVLINKAKHRNLKLLAIENFSFAKELKFIPVVVGEADALANDYPIVIITGENPSLGIIVALDGDNLSINENGKWYGSYVPAYLRKYPFALGSMADNKVASLMLIDIDSSLVSTEKGEVLFDEEGKQSAIFQEKIHLVSTYEKEKKVTAQIIQILIEANILESGEIVVGEGEERKVLVTGFNAVSKAKLEALSPEITKDWKSLGVTKFIEAHLKSFDSIKKLFTLASRQQH